MSSFTLLFKNRRTSTCVITDWISDTCYKGLTGLRSPLLAPNPPLAREQETL